MCSSLRLGFQRMLRLAKHNDSRHYFLQGTLSPHPRDAAWARRETARMFRETGYTLPDEPSWSFHDLESLLDQLACLYARCPSLSVHAMSSMHPGVVRALKARIRTALGDSELCNSFER